MLAKSPSFTTIAVLTLALGIGANTAIFSLINATLVEPLPYPESDRLVVLWQDASFVGFPKSKLSVPDYLDWKDQNTTFEGMVASFRTFFNLTGKGDPLRIQGLRATGDLYDVLGVQPLYGRGFTREEDRMGGPNVAVISHALWQTVFGGEREVVGQEISLNGQKFTLLGVMPPRFHFPDSGIDLWAPAQFNPFQMETRDANFLTVVGRLRAGVPLRTAQADIETLAFRHQKEYPDTHRNLGSRLLPLKDELVGDVAPGFFILLAAVGCVLLITCANLANLLLVRAVGRRHDLAIRHALGAGGWTLARQLLIESLLLAIGGGALGLLVAVWSFDFVSYLVPKNVSLWTSLELDFRVLAFSACLTGIVGIAFGLMPLVHTSRIRLLPTLQPSGRQSSTDTPSRWARDTLVVGEVALAVVLLISTGLLIRSFARVRGIDLGFRPEGVLTARMDLSWSRFEDLAARLPFYDRVLESVRALPGVEAAGFVSFLPLTLPGGSWGFNIEGRAPLPQGQVNSANRRIITPDYLEAMGITLKEGRLFDVRDGHDSTPVVVINEAMAHQFWANEDPLGTRLRLGDYDDEENPWLTVVGIVGNVRQAGLEVEGRPQFYQPATQAVEAEAGGYEPHYLAVRTKGDPLLFSSAVREAIRENYPNQAVAEVRTMEEIVDQEIFQRRAQTQLLTGFAGIALLLASVGIYGVLSHAVTQRTQEIGVRTALGAQSNEIVRLVLNRGMRLAAVGVLIGISASVGVSHLLRALLYEVSTTDATTFFAAPAVVFAVAIAASYLPARRATKVDPMVALRYE